MTRREQDAPYTHNNQNCQTPFKEKAGVNAEICARATELEFTT
jgi:hypothetical protein